VHALAHLADFDRHHLGARGVGAGVRVKVELELPLSFCREAAQDAAERRALLELGGDVANREQVRERVLAGIAGARRLPQQPPLGQVAQVVLGDGRVQAAKVAVPIRAAGR
jgi:hypothetical protein